MFSFNNLSGSPKPANATVASSTTWPSRRSNLNTDNTGVTSGVNSNLNTGIASRSQSDSNTSLFVFGKQNQDTDLKTCESFNFMFNSNCLDPSLIYSNTDSKADKSSSVKFSIMNDLFDIQEKMEPKIEDKTRAELDSDNNNENASASSVQDEESNNQESGTVDENAWNQETGKIIVKEFKDVVSSFVQERIKGEKKIAALEARITTLEEQVQNLKTGDYKKSSANNDDPAQSNPVSQQPLNQPPATISRQIPSPLVPSPAESCTLKKSAFGSTSSLFGSSSASLFNGTNTFGSAASSIIGNDSTTCSNFVLGTSAFNPTGSTKISGGSQLFSSTNQASNQNGKSLAPERKKVQKLFSPEAVTEFLNAQKEPGTNNLPKAHTGNTFEQNQNVPTKEGFELHLQRTIEMCIKKAMEGYWEHFQPNTSENSIKKFNSGNMFL